MKKIRLEKIVFAGYIFVENTGNKRYYAVDRNKIFYLISKETYDEIGNWGIGKVCLVKKLAEAISVKKYEEHEFELDGIYLNCEKVDWGWKSKIELMLENIIKNTTFNWDEDRKRGFESFVIESFENDLVKSGTLYKKLIIIDEDGKSKSKDLENNEINLKQIEQIEFVVMKMLQHKQKTLDKFNDIFYDWFNKYWKRELIDTRIILDMNREQ